jgi:hypothetical protein
VRSVGGPICIFSSPLHSATAVTLLTEKKKKKPYPKGYLFNSVFC